MNRCNNCDKLIWWWNKFKRQYGEGKIIDGGEITEYVNFCSEECCMEWKDVRIDFNKQEETK